MTTYYESWQWTVSVQGEVIHITQMMNIDEQDCVQIPIGQLREIIRALEAVAIDRCIHTEPDTKE